MKREEKERANGSRVRDDAARRRFCSTEDDARPSDQNQRPRMLGLSPAQAGVSARGTLPAQAQVAAWVRPAARKEDWAELVFAVSGRAGLK